MLGIDDDLGCEWRFVRIRYAGKVCELSNSRPRIQAFWIAALQLVKRAAGINLHEVPKLLAHFIPRCAVGRDRRDNHPYAIARKQARHETNATYVLVAVFPGEPKAPR